MEKIDKSLVELAHRCEQVLGANGQLAAAIDNFVARPQQVELAAAIAHVLTHQNQLVAEAGTGTGKTFAYLIPCLLSGKKTIISTATKTLQDQLIQKDLPLLTKALALSVRVQNLKGRANYICRYRTELYIREGQFVNQQSAHDIALIHAKLPRLIAGDRHELPEISETSPAWPYVTSTADNCLGRECEHHKNCFLMKARKRALEADLVVINHHLFFADSQLKDDGFGELLPTAQAIIFDEAHQLAETAMHFQGKRFSTRQLREVMDDMLQEWPVLDLANQPLKQLSAELDRISDELILSVNQSSNERHSPRAWDEAAKRADERLVERNEKNGGARNRLSWQEIKHNKRFNVAWQQLMTLMETWLSSFMVTAHPVPSSRGLTAGSTVLDTSLDPAVKPREDGYIEKSEQLRFKQANVQDEPGLVRCQERLAELNTIMQLFASGNKVFIPWIETFKRTLVFHLTPFDIANDFKALIERHQCGTVFTSATLTMSDSFDCFTKALGLSQPTLLQLPSPFDFKQQALLYLPRGLPDPKDQRYYDILLTKVVPVIQACGGRSFFLFTSHRALKEVAETLHQHLPFPLLIQGEESKPILLTRFRALGNAVLLGTATFWEGVDVKGDALSCVIIDKLPFASPMDPIIRGRMAYLKEQGLSGFDELSLPNAVLALKQGVGRLIRDMTDKGVLIIADPRLTARDYGQAIFKSLPSMRKTRDEETVLTFIETL